jgi:GH25 family lysozyme M1 (1,4-beta-N-acetylmuramidase)
MKTQSSGVILRAGQATWEDVCFQRFRDGAELAGFPYGNYWYFDNDVEPKRQAEKWAAIVGDRDGELGCWIDIEDSGSGQYGSYKYWWDCVAYFKQIKPSAVLGIYTRASYFNDPKYGVPLNHAFRNLPLWVAHYGASQPDMPKGWTDWLLWQFSENGDGHAHGVGSWRIDMNFYKGDIMTEEVSHITAIYQDKKVRYTNDNL